MSSSSTDRTDNNLFSLLYIPFKEIESATNSFAEKNLLTKGNSFEVYKGQLLQSPDLIDIVARKCKKRNRVTNELEISKKLKHKNIVSTFKLAFGNNEDIIINKYEANESLDIHLGGSTLTWVQRLHICVGVAKALCYLHYDVDRNHNIIHGNIKSSKILLDNNWEPKLHGFAFAVKAKKNQLHRTNKYNGSLKYMDPTYETTQGLTHKSDVFSFGVVLFEVLFGVEASIENNDKWYFARLARSCYEERKLEDLIHPRIRKQMNLQSSAIYIETAYCCLKEQRSHRPDMGQVLSRLQRALEIQHKHERSTAVVEDRSTKHLKGTNNLNPFRFALSDIQLATNYFSETYLIGSGAYGKVYKAELEHFDGINSLEVQGKNQGVLPKKHSIVAIKRISSRADAQGEQGYFREIEMLSKCNHQNIVSLLGFCDEKSEFILVYDYVSNGSIENHLENTDNMKSFTWAQRIKICLDIAYGLDYLHKQCIIHRDVKSANVLLDDNWVAKIGDFGLSVLHHLSPQHSTLFTCNIAGTKMYLDPEYESTGKLKAKSDIYSFGVVLFEIMCGKLAYDKSYNEAGLPSIARQCFNDGTLNKLVDPKIKEVGMLIEGGNSFDTFSKIAIQCLAKTQSDRPTMESVIKELKKSLQFEEERIQRLNADRVINRVDKLQLIRNIAEEGIQRSNADHVVNKVEKLQLTRGIVENKLGHLKIHLNDIKLATNNFSKTYTIASVDGECTLYRAELHCFDKENPSSEKGKNKGDHPKGHNIVVIKRYHSQCFGEEELFTEIEMLSTVEHPNIVNLIGFCIEDSEMILVIENVSNGYLDGYLGNDNDMRILTWEKRLKICIEVANALDHLHSEMEDQKMIIHRDICSYNIGLDENWRAKIDGFGTCVFLPPNQEDEAVYIEWRGRSEYIDPEYEKIDKLKRESDVYSFGVVLFEILCGRTASNPIYMKENVRGLGPVARQSFCTGTLEDMIDPILKEETSEYNFVLKRGPNKESLDTFMKIAYQCVAETQDQRPTMKVVVKELEKALSFQLKSHASVIETQVLELSNELNSMNMTDKSENFEIHNKENMLHDQTDDPAEPDC